MAELLSVASTAVSLARVAVVDSDEIVCSKYNSGPRTLP
jgi:hypothetical protein